MDEAGLLERLGDALVHAVERAADQEPLGTVGILCLTTIVLVLGLSWLKQVHERKSLELETRKLVETIAAAQGLPFTGRTPRESKQIGSASPSVGSEGSR
ncbi:hypothetical protein [Tistlia consotensis]|uniref:hypothetical protein n=1 Tax=Tistlia consotensis TaxID=1321365 RepID=UPI00117CB398|nr:hypothetical protein [Tistlia consotensis]